MSLTQKDNLAVRELIQDLPDDSPFHRLYHHLLQTWLARLVGRPMSYSGHAKMRVHFPGTGSVSGFHADVPVTRRIDQVNLWVPFTDVEDSAALWLESDYGLADFAPVPLRYGEALIFDGGYLGPQIGTQQHQCHADQHGPALRVQGFQQSRRRDRLMNHLIGASIVKERGQ